MGRCPLAAAASACADACVLSPAALTAALFAGGGACAGAVAEAWRRWDGSDYQQHSPGAATKGGYTTGEWGCLLAALLLAPLGCVLLQTATHRAARVHRSVILTGAAAAACAALAAAALSAARPWAAATNQFDTYFGLIAAAVAGTFATSAAAATARLLRPAPSTAEGGAAATCGFGPLPSCARKDPEAAGDGYGAGSRPRRAGSLGAAHLAFLLLLQPCVAALSMLLPSMWTKFSWEGHAGGSPNDMGEDTVRVFNSDPGTGGGVVNEYTGQTHHNRAAIVVHLGSVDGAPGQPDAPVYARLWWDVLLYNAFIYAVALAGAASACSATVHRALHRRVLGSRRATMGEVLLCLLFAALLAAWIVCWAQHVYMDTPGRRGQDVAARVCGQCANLMMALLVLPLPRTSVWSGLLGVSWEAGIRFHRALGYACLAFGFAHMCLWWKVFSMDQAVRDAPEFDPAQDWGQTGCASDWWPSAPICFHSDNFTIPAITVVFWASLVLILGLSVDWVRRNHFEVFYYAHHFSLVLFIAALMHATSLWYYLISGLALWWVDRVVRFDRSARTCTVRSAVAHGSGPSAVTELEVEVAGGLAFAPGQFCFLNAPQLGLWEWHPFTISSAPGDGRVTFHIKSMARPIGGGKFDTSTWTCNLHELVSQAAAVGEAPELTVSVDGPYGTPPRADRYRRVVYCVGGIGVTPAHSAVREAAHAAAAEAGEQEHYVGDGMDDCEPGSPRAARRAPCASPCAPA